MYLCNVKWYWVLLMSFRGCPMKYVLQKSICKMVCLKSVVCLCRNNIYLKFHLNIYLTFYWLSGILLILISRLWHCVVKHCIITKKMKCTTFVQIFAPIFSLDESALQLAKVRASICRFWAAGVNGFSRKSHSV